MSQIKPCCDNKPVAWSGSKSFCPQHLAEYLNDLAKQFPSLGHRDPTRWTKQ